MNDAMSVPASSDVDCDHPIQHTRMIAEEEDTHGTMTFTQAVI